MANKEQSIKEVRDSDPYFWIKQDIKQLESLRAKRGLFIKEREKLATRYKMLQQKLPFGETK